MITKDKLAEIEEACKVAHSEIWTYEPINDEFDSPMHIIAESGRVLGVLSCPVAAYFVSIANPHVILELIEELKETKVELDWIARKYTDAFNMLGRHDRMTIAKALLIAKEATSCRES